MRYTTFPGLPQSPKLSVLGFGCSALLGRAGRKESLAALAAAWDAGITFYDTARSYGYGESEALLGGFLANRRDQAVICTKFGILPPAKAGWKQKIKPLAQAAVRLAPGLRRMAQRAARSEFQSNQFTVEGLRSSVETSLRALQTDYVDLLIMHAAPVSALHQEDLLEAMARLVAEGKARLAGISAEQSVIERFFQAAPAPLTTAQFALNLDNMAFAEVTAAQRGLLLVANHPYGGAGGVAATLSRVTALAAGERLPPPLREKLAAGDRQLMPELVLNAILRGTGIDAVVPAMMQIRNIDSNVRAIEHCRFSDDELAALRAALR